PAATPTNIVIGMLPPMSQVRLSSGITARNHSAQSGITATGAANRAARAISAARRARSRSIVLITTHEARPARVAATAVRNRSDGEKLGLKNPAHTPPPPSHAPGVSCHDRMPLIQNRLIHAAIA